MTARSTRTRIRRHAKMAARCVEDAQRHLADLKQIRDDALPEKHVWRDDSITNTLPELVTALSAMQQMIEEWTRRL